MKTLAGSLLVFLRVMSSPAALSWHWNALPTDVGASNDIAWAMSVLFTSDGGVPPDSAKPPEFFRLVYP